MTFSELMENSPCSHERGAIVALEGRQVVVELFERNRRVPLLLDSDDTYLRTGDRITAHFDTAIGSGQVMLEKSGIGYMASTLAN